MSLRPGELLIGQHNYLRHIGDVIVDGQVRKRGLIPRDYNLHPRGCYAGIQAVDLPTIPRAEWSARCTDKAGQKSRNSDVRLIGNGGAMIPSRDQNGKGYCWMHSGVSASIMLRALMNEPYVSLSAYAGACIIKDYRDEGGWGAQGVDFLIQRGIPSDAFWPQQSMSKANDKPETWANAALHKITGGWIDMQAAQYDRNLTFDQYATLFLLNCPAVTDFNWWSHSVCGVDLVDGNTNEARMACRAESGKFATASEYEAMWGITNPVTAGFGIRIWNSWGDSWSDKGMGVLTGSQAIPDGGVGLRSTLPSAA